MVIDFNKRMTSDEESDRGMVKTFVYKWMCFLKLREYERIGTPLEFKMLKEQEFKANVFDIIKKTDVCPKCGEKTLVSTYIPNDDNNTRFGCKIFGVICTNCCYEYYDNHDE